MSDTTINVQEVRDHAQEIAVREAGEIARWQQVVACIDAAVAAAHRYINEALPVPRSSGQNAADTSANFEHFQLQMVRGICAARFVKATLGSTQNVTTEQMAKVVEELPGPERTE
jgi:hypothetical protein